MSKLRRWVTLKDKVAYQRIVSGFLYHRFEHVRFLTLTNKSADDGSPLVPLGYQVEKLKVFMRWIRRTYGKVEYFSVHTNEGNGVFHLLITGPYLPVKALREKWVELTGAYRVNIQLVVREDGMPSKKMFSEMTRQCDVIRYSCSKGWLKPNSISIWSKVRGMTKEQPWEIDGHLFVFRKSSAIELFQDWIRSDSEFVDLTRVNVEKYLLGVVGVR